MTSKEIEQIRKKLISLKDDERAEHSKRYLTSPYRMYGTKVPDVKAIAKEYKNLDFYSTLNLADELWNSGNHEEMWIALALLRNYVKKNAMEIWKFMSKRWEKACTWDLVDELSTHILGEIFAERIDLTPEIKQLCQDKNPWLRRIGIVSNLPVIKKNKIELTLQLAEKLVYDENDYVQKGVGWMLREAGKKNRLAVREFILHHINMKPIAFSYATEKMTELRAIRKNKKKEEKKELKRKTYKP